MKESVFNMAFQMAASHAAGKQLKDAIFGASAACRAASEKYGEDRVTNATIGAVMDDAGKLAHLPTVERIFRALPIEDYIAYAPIAPRYPSGRLPAKVMSMTASRYAGSPAIGA